MTDPADQFSHPLKVEKRELCTLYYLTPRRKWEGREAIIGYDGRFPLIEGFKNNYTSFIRFFDKGWAANHYHASRGEMWLPIQSRFEFLLEDIKTKKSDRFQIDPKDNIAFYIRPGIAHAFRPLDDHGLILEMSAQPLQESDIFPYPLH